MKHVTITFAVIALVAQTAQAGHLGFGGGGPGLGGHHGGFGEGGFGHQDELGLFGGLGFDTERLQARFETKFEDLMSDYDTGLADIEDFYSSDEYSDVVDGVEHLVDRYDLFLGGVERSIDRLGDFISIANDDLTYYDELIAEYEAREDLSEERLERILDRLTNFQERLTTKIDFLTEKQTTLSENFASYETFSTDLSTYLTEIVTAGGGTIDDSTEETLDATAGGVRVAQHGPARRTRRRFIVRHVAGASQRPLRPSRERNCWVLSRWRCSCFAGPLAHSSGPVDLTATDSAKTPPVGRDGSPPVRAHHRTMRAGPTAPRLVPTVNS